MDARMLSSFAGLVAQAACFLCLLLAFRGTDLFGCPLGGGSVAHAQAQDVVLGLYVDPTALSPEALRASLEAELGFPLELLAAPEASRPTLHVISVPSDGVRITLEGGGGRRVERDAPLLDHEMQGIETVTFLASNMLRNEAAGLLRELNVIPGDSEKLPPVHPSAASSATPIHDPLTTFNACLTRVTVPVGVDFLPTVGMSTSQAGRRAVRGFSFGVLGSYARGARGATISGFLSVQREFMCGVTISGGANVVLGGSQGLLVAPFNLVMRASGGATLGVLNVVRGKKRGLSAGLGNLVLHDHSGASVGLLNLNHGHFRGAAEGALNFATKSVEGVQLGVGNVSGSHLTGGQVGIGNIALGNMRGVQLGIANVTGKEARGLQFGVFNYAEKNRAPIGLVSIVRHGRTDLEIWGPSESGTVLLGVSHGGERVHNLYYVGARTGAAGQRFVAALGIGVRLLEHGIFRLDLDAVSQYIYREGADAPTFQQGIRAPFTFVVTEGLGVMVGPSYQFFISDDPYERSQAPFGRSVLSDERSSVRVEAFPGIAAGVRFELPSESERAGE